jgi:prepilin peptidase CpaA
MTSPHVVALSVAAIACAVDLRTRRIPNVLTFGAAAAALVFHFAVSGVNGLETSVGGWVAGVALLFAPYALGGMGAGDVKLLGALGAWLGPGETLWVVMYTGIAGGAMALIVSFAHGYLRQACSNIWLLFAHWRVMGLRPLAEVTLEGSRGPRLAYAAPILLGTIVTLWLS